MDGFNFKLSAAQVALITDMLKPYVELSASISYQYQMQIRASANPVKAEKVETTEKTEKQPEDKKNG